jgi:RNA polymerase sigma factor (TIGR02999 family)
MDTNPGEVTQLLKVMSQGDGKAAEVLFPLFIPNSTGVPGNTLRRERPNHTLQATALINEAYRRPAQQDVDWNSRAHFIGIAAQVIRRVLVDYARAHVAEQRAAASKRVDPQEELFISSRQLDQVVLLDEVLRKLETHNPRQLVSSSFGINERLHIGYTEASLLDIMRLSTHSQ